MIKKKKTIFYLSLCKDKFLTQTMKLLLKNPDTAFNVPESALLKNGNSATLVKYKLDNNEFVIKRYNMKTSRHALRRAFKKSRADHSWHYAHLISKMKIHTPFPVAMKEKRWGPFRNKAFFICEYVEGPTALNYFNDPEIDHAAKSAIAEKIIAMFGLLKSAMITHGDMKATNIIIHNMEPYLIDLDSMTAHKTDFRFKRAWQKDIKRFMKNWKDLPGVFQLFSQLRIV